MRIPVPSSPNFFLAKITDISAAPAYQFSELWADPTGAQIVKSGGRYGGALNPGYAVDPATTFAVDDIALARQAEGAGGTIWELVPLSGGLTSGEAALSGTFSLTGSTDVMQDTGLSITLPSAGTYLLRWHVTGELQITTGAPVGSVARIRSRLYDADNAQFVPNTESIVCWLTNWVTGSLIADYRTVGGEAKYTITSAGATVHLYAARANFSTGTGAFALSQLQSAEGFGSGGTHLGYLKIG